jgi:hypothetical protein
MAINPKFGGLSALDPQDDAVDPQNEEFDYGSDNADLRSYLASKVKARDAAVAALPTWEDYTAALSEARQPRSRMSQISEALLAYGRPLEQGQSKWQSLGNAATTLTKGIEAEEAAKRAEQVKRAQLRMQYLKAKSDVEGPYDEAIDAIAIKAYSPVKAGKAPTLVQPLQGPDGRYNIHPYQPDIMVPPNYVIVAGTGEMMPSSAFAAQYSKLSAQANPPAAGQSAPSTQATPAPTPAAPAAAQPAPASGGALPGVKKLNSREEFATLAPGEKGSFEGEVQFGTTGGPKVIVSKPEPPKPLPPKLQEAEDENLEAIRSFSDTNADLQELTRQIDKGDINLSLVGNALTKARTFVGIGGDAGTKLSGLETTIKRIRDQTLLLNKGTQTENDAKRALETLVGSMNDENKVRAALIKIAKYNQSALKTKSLLIQNRRKSYGLELLDLTPYYSGTPAVGGSAEAPRDPAAREKGKRYSTPKGDLLWTGTGWSK